MAVTASAHPGGNFTAEKLPTIANFEVFFHTYDLKISFIETATMNLIYTKIS